MKIFILLAIILLPYVLNADNIITLDGKTYEDIKILEVKFDKITFSHKKGITSLSSDKFSQEVKDKYGLSEKTSVQDAPNKKGDKIGDEEKINKEFEDSLNYAKTNSEKYKNKINYYIGPDRGTVLSIINFYEGYIKSYSTGIPDKDKAVNEYKRFLNELHSNKTVYGYQYNELLKTEIPVPITFDLYDNTDNFYIKIGDGTFSTIVPIELETLVKLNEQLKKIFEWNKQCIKEKLDVSKDAGQFNGLNFTFVSEGKGDNIYVWLKANGDVSEYSIFENQTVRLNMLNLRTLSFKISKAPEMFKERQRIRDNSKKLK